MSDVTADLPPAIVRNVGAIAGSSVPEELIVFGVDVLAVAKRY